MDERLIGTILIVIGLITAGVFGGTMSDIFSAFMYIFGFIIAFAGLYYWLRWYRANNERS